MIPFALVVPGVIGYAYIDHQIHTPANPGDGKIRVVIPPGATFHQTADILHQAGLIDNELVFDLYARYRHLDRGVQAGAYQLDSKLNMEQILLALQVAVPDEIFVTIPEGYTIQKTAKRLDAGGVIKGSEYVALATHGTFDDQFAFLHGRPAGASLEGFLFPETYLIPRDAKAKDLIIIQLKQFGTEWTDARQAEATQRKLKVLDVVTLASLIEREARFDDDRAKVASVIYNRLAKGMLLQIDATVLYAKGVWQATVTYDDRKIDSPYNTYLHPGLPPGPIANPGIKAIDAALNPAQTDYLYYLSDPQGHLHFARTNEEFNQLLKQYGLS
jgi:peptidoglycan lytic transglycosylase G